MLQFGGTLVLSLLPTRASLAASSVAVSFSPPFNLFELRVCVRINRLLSWLVGGLRMAAAAMVLRVCVVLETGFSMLKDDAIPTSLVKSDSSLVGYDVAVRTELLTNKAKVPYTVSVVGSYGELQVKTRVGDCDIGWGYFFNFGSRDRCKPNAETCQDVDSDSIKALIADPKTNWEPFRCCNDFAPSHLSGKMQAMALVTKSTGSASFFGSLFTIFSEAFFVNYISFLFLWVAICAHIMWALERKGNSEEFPKPYLDGIDDAIWWSIVTVTTVGFGDKTPKSPAGRILGIVWMVFGVALGAVLIGHMSSRFSTLATEAGGYTSLRELDGLSLCSYPSSFTRDWLDGIRTTQVSKASMAECGQLIKDGTVAAGLMERPTAAYYVKTNSWTKDASVVISGPVVHQPMSILYPEANKRRSITIDGIDYATAINALIMDYVNTAAQLQAENNWFPQGTLAGSAAAQEKYNWPFVGTAVGVVSIYLVVQLARSISLASSPKKVKPKTEPVLSSRALTLAGTGKELGKAERIAPELDADAVADNTK